MITAYRRSVDMMSESKHNRRTQRTKRAIYTAFAELLSEKELHKITVQELVDRADIGRATFYTHYLDIYDLNEKIEGETMTEIAYIALELDEQPAEEFFKSLLDYMYDNRAVFKMIFSPNNTGQLHADLTQMIEGVFRQVESEKTGSKLDDKRLAYISRYRAQGCLAVISMWVEGGFAEPKEFIVETITELDNSIEGITA